MKIGDIDIDVKSSFDPSFTRWIPASVYDEEKQTLKAHPVGMHPQKIPVDPLTGLSAIPYDRAEEFGYAKVDFLTLYLYDKVLDRAELSQFLNTEPDWSLLQDQHVQPKLFQLHKHGEILNLLKPNCIEDIACILALVRPGKRQLIGLYQKSKHLAEDVLWEDSGSGYQFKKSHAICYAMVIQVQLHLIQLGRM